MSAPEQTNCDDTRLNVASLLLDDIGAQREYLFAFPTFQLDDDLIAHDVTGVIRFTRLEQQLMAKGSFQGRVTMECVRCLNEFDEHFTAKFTEFFRQSVDVRTGHAYDPHQIEPTEHEEDEEDSGFGIDESHQLDVAEAIRQWIVLSLPMTPNCGPDCPGLQIPGETEADGDHRLAGLAALLDEEDSSEAQ